jgi:hypothetical protein
MNDRTLDSVLDVELDNMRPLTDAEQKMAVALLLEARRLNNLTVRPVDEVVKWHRYADAFLADKPGDDPEERYDAQHREEARAFAHRVFGWGRLPIKRRRKALKA